MPRTTVSINEVAARLKLSKGTVSRILNDPTSPFAEETRKRVLEMAKEMGYRPNSVARALATGKTGCVALWVPNLLSSYHAQVAQSFETQIESHDLRLVINLLGWESVVDRGDHFVSSLTGSVDGVIAHGANLQGVSQHKHSIFRGVPIISSDIIDDPEIPDYVAVDLSLVTQEAVAHLIKPGRKRVAYLFHNLEHRLVDDRYLAYMSVMQGAGLQPELIDASGERRSAVRTSLKEYIKEHGAPEAIFCHNDDFAIAAYRALNDIGLNVPNDVALIGCDGIEDTEYLSTPISTIAQPFDELCRLTWQYLKRRMEEPDAPPQQTILQPKLVLRESSVS